MVGLRHAGPATSEDKKMDGLAQPPEARDAYRIGCIAIGFQLVCRRGVPGLGVSPGKGLS